MGCCIGCDPTPIHASKQENLLEINNFKICGGNRSPIAIAVSLLLCIVVEGEAGV